MSLKIILQAIWRFTIFVTESNGLNGAISELNKLIEKIKMQKENEQIALLKLEKRSGKQRKQSKNPHFYIFLRNSKSKPFL